MHVRHVAKPRDHRVITQILDCCNKMNNENWLSTTSKVARAELKKSLTDKLLAENGLDATGNPEPEAHLAKLPVWQRTSTTASAFEVTPTGAAILPKSVIGHDHLPRIDGWQKILKAIGWGKHRKYVADLLHDIEFQHHQSTNGRMNSSLGRWERYGVRSVDNWRNGMFNYGLGQMHLGNAKVPKSTFHTIKDGLIGRGLIEAEAHLWMGDTHLWIKPANELSRILFDPGYWETVQHLYATAKPAQAPKPKSKGKPRGMSAKLAALDEELMDTYRAVIHGEMHHLPKQSRWAIWERLTKPIPMGKNYSKAPFAELQSYRASRIHNALMLQYD